ncbi:ubiquitin conjugation factor E4 B-like [Convolutriloba macropyga]|uniref:ubiquitin conjugation factor E4 B-like n=1 Tax=Convolutriloba macropyga TaxID=536237 RepID=UPI003F51C948
MSESSDTNSTPRSGDVVVDTSPGGNSSPQGGVDTTSERPGLDADEMRRRRLAKINSSNANVTSVNSMTDLSSSQPIMAAKLPATIIGIDPAFRDGDTLSTTTTHGPPPSIKSKRPHTTMEESLFSLARTVCGSNVKFLCSTDEQFATNTKSFLGSAILESCVRIYQRDETREAIKRIVSSEGNVKAYSCLLFLFELNQSSLHKKNELVSSQSDAICNLKLELLSQIERFSLRYSVLTLSNYFANDEVAICDAGNSVLYHLLLEKSESWSFMVAMASAIKSEFSHKIFATVFGSLLQTLCTVITLNSSVVNPKASATLSMLGNLMEVQIPTTGLSSDKPGGGMMCKPFSELIVKLDNWIPPPLTPAEGREIQKLSVLGPFLSVSCLNEDEPTYAASVVPTGLSDFKDMSVSKQIQQKILQVRTQQHQLVRTLLVNQSTRANILDLLANFLTRNTKRAQLSPDPSSLATHGFMLNLMYILCELEVKVTLDKVDPDYLVHPKSRFSLADESLMKMSSPQLSEYRESLKSASDPRFPTECFFLTLYGTHICFIPAIKHHLFVIRTYKQLKAVLADAEKQQQRMSNSFVEGRMRDLRAQLESYYRNVVTLGAVLMEENLLSMIFHFYSKVMDLLLMMVSEPSSTKDIFGSVQTPVLPLAQQVSKQFAAFPSFIIEDVADFVNFVVRHSPSTVSTDTVSGRSLVNFLVTFSCSPNYISNPYLVAKLIEIIFYLNPTSNTLNSLYQQILDHREAVVHFAASLTRFYVSIESTGGTNEFYDKFSIRYHLTIIFQSMWNHPSHKLSMVNTLNSEGKEIVRFVNLLINDTTFLLDESLECIKRIHETQQLIKNTSEWNKLSREQQASRRKKLHEDESQCRSYMTLVNETLNMFHYLTREVQKPFLLPEIIGRLAAMLNSYLSQLVGPNYKELNIENRDKYGFQPKGLLDQITDLYLHLDSPELIEAIAADDRSYREEIFVNADETLCRVGLKTPAEMERFRRIASEAKQCYLNNIQMEEDFEDAPEHYRDPITQALMTDPVQLPSGKVMDRSVLTRILLDSAIDPFSRQPLSPDSIQECPQLKAEIENWKRNRTLTPSNNRN